MPTTLLAVDDSVTIRKCLEITFGSDEFQVVLADGRDAALSKAADAGVVVVDAVLGGDDGYALAKELRGKLPKAAIILLSSRYNPYDAAKGQDAGVDDFCDKPFDSQQLIDKTKKAMTARASGIAASPAAPPPIPAAAAPAAPAAAAAPAPASVGGPPPIPGAPASAPRAGAPGTGPKPTAERARTLMFGDGPAQAPASVAGAAPKGPPPVPTAAPAVPAAAAPQAPVAAAHAPAAAAGDMHGKLSALGLTKEQIDGVLALTRDVIEKAVWEVVPQMAEMMIKEEIERLTKE